ncbi:hypothetical protein GIB67_002935, partial [Kingdonia uniflora]
SVAAGVLFYHLVRNNSNSFDLMIIRQMYSSETFSFLASNGYSVSYMHYFYLHS